MINKHLFWMAPAAIVCCATPCFATQYLSIEQAQQLCFPTATKWVASTVDLTKDQLSWIEKDSGIQVRFPKQKIWEAYDGTTRLGWFIVDQVVGKHEFIQWALALEADGSVHQIEVLDYRETYGAEIRQKKWQSQFVGKKHGAQLKLDKDIQNISGATLSSRHITDGVKRLLSFYELILKNR